MLVLKLQRTKYIDMMPWQLRKGLYERRQSRHTEPKPLVENLPAINVNDLGVQRNSQPYIASNISFRFPHINAMRINYSMVEFAHSDRVQTFHFKWIKTGYGYPRPAFICECGRPVINLYLYHTNLACRR